MSLSRMASPKYLAIVFMVFQGIIHQSDAVVTFSSPATGTLVENSASGTEIEQLVATGETSPYTYAITARAPDLDWFVIDGDKLKVKDGVIVDFDAASLIATSQVITITITATDSTAAGAVTGNQDFVLTITNVDEAPEFTLTSLAAKLATGAAGTTLLTIAATDPESAPGVTYGLVATSDAHVEISGAVISVKTGVTLADCVKVIAVKATDATNNAGGDYGVACIGSCSASCDGSGAGAITGNGLGILTALVVLMVLCDRFH